MGVTTKSWLRKDIFLITIQLLQGATHRVKNICKECLQATLKPHLPIILRLIQALQEVLKRLRGEGLHHLRGGLRRHLHLFPEHHLRARLPCGWNGTLTLPSALFQKDLHPRPTWGDPQDYNS